MNSTVEPTNAAASGSPTTTKQPTMPALKPWDIAELPLFRFQNGQVVDVEHATSEQFEAWRSQNGIPAKPGAWSFERRCKAINMCRFYGTWSQLRFPIDFCAESSPGAQKSADSAQNEADQTVPGADFAQMEQDIEPTDAPEKLPTVIALLSQNPSATDEDIRLALGLRTHGVARMWKILAQERIAAESMGRHK